MDVADESTANGTNVGLWQFTGGANQQFEVVDLNNGGYYAIMPMHSGKSLDVWSRSTADGGEIRQYDYSGMYHQQWRIEDTGQGRVRILSRHSDKALAAYNGGTKPGTDIRQHDVQQASSQYWVLEPIESKSYQLVWSEEFDYEGLPRDSYWSYESGLVRNNEAQYYTVARPENVNVANGMLTITARRENYDGANYTAASLHTRGKVDWTYGRFEMRARLDTRTGLWPAFWLLGNGKWPESGEVDVMEFYQNKILANVAWKANNSDPWSAQWDSSTRSLTNLRYQDPDWDNQFHTWRMDWDENSIRLYVDDVLMNSTNTNNTINPDGSNPFRGKPMYLLINLAIGGNNGGDPSGTSFPATYEIDYVRVYQ